LEYDVDIYEDSMPFRFTPDGLDEATIDDLIEQAYAQVNDDTFTETVDHPARNLTDEHLSNDEAA
jgi:hypothetical protein